MPKSNPSDSTLLSTETVDHPAGVGKARKGSADHRVILQASKLICMISRARELNENLMGLVSPTSQHRQFERLVDKFRRESQALRRLKACGPDALLAQEKALQASIELQNEETSGWTMIQLTAPCEKLAM